MIKKEYITIEHERELIKNYQETGNEEVLQELIDSHLAYVKNVAAKQFKKFGKIVAFEDLIQEGLIGLIKAIIKFDLEKSVINPETGQMVENIRLMTYASRWIIAEMQNLWQKSLPMHIPAHTLRSIYFNITKQGKDGEKKKALAKERKNIASLDDVNMFDKNMNFLNQKSMMYRNHDDPTFIEGTNTVFSPVISKQISKLSEKEWKILQMKFGLEDGFCYNTKQISMEMNIPVEEVEHLYKKAKRNLSRNLVKNKIGVE